MIKIRHHFVHVYFYINNAINYFRLKKIRFNTRMNSKKKLTILFVCQAPALWNSMKPVFEEALRRNAQVYILAVPEKKIKNNFSITAEEYDDNIAYSFCKKFYDQVINAYDEKKKQWFNIRKLKLDYVFLPRPYDIYLPKIYRSSYLVSYTKLCYINYAYNFENYADTLVYKAQFIKNIYLLFPESKFSEDSINLTRNKNHITWNNVKLYGYPRFSLLHQKKERATNKICVLWTPRWTTNEQVCASHFFEYKDKLFSFIKGNIQFELIFRPHPLLFRNFLSTGELSTDEYLKLLQDINDTDNISLDETGDYIDSFSKSDVLITDTSGLVMDYYITGKPIVFCGSKVDFSANFSFLYDSLYNGTSWEHIVITLQDLTRNDELFEERSRNISRISSFTDVSKNILDFMETDFAAIGK